MYYYLWISTYVLAFYGNMENYLALYVGSHVAPPETDTRTLPGKPQSCSNVKINRNELN